MLLSKIKHSFTFIKYKQTRHLKIKIIKIKQTPKAVSQNLILSKGLNQWNTDYLISLNCYNYNYFDTKRLLNLLINQKCGKIKSMPKKNLIKNQFLNLL